MPRCKPTKPSISGPPPRAPPLLPGLGPKPPDPPPGLEGLQTQREKRMDPRDWMQCKSEGWVGKLASELLIPKTRWTGCKCATGTQKDCELTGELQGRGTCGCSPERDPVNTCIFFFSCVHVHMHMRILCCCPSPPLCVSFSPSLPSLPPSLSPSLPLSLSPSLSLSVFVCCVCLSFCLCMLCVCLGFRV